MPENSVASTAAAARAAARTFCDQRLGEGYADIAAHIIDDADAVGALAAGRANTWAAGAVRMLAHANLLSADPSELVITTGQIAAAFGTTEGTVSSKSTTLMRAVEYDARESAYLHPTRGEAHARRVRELDAYDQTLARIGTGPDDCPFHEMPDVPAETVEALPDTTRLYAETILAIRAGLDPGTGFGRCAHATLARYVNGLLFADCPWWGEDPEGDETLIAALQDRATASGGSVEDLSDKAFERTMGSMLEALESVVPDLTEEDDWAVIRPDVVSEAPSASQLRAIPSLRLPSHRCFLDLEDDEGHPRRMHVDDLHVSVHGAFIRQPRDGSLLVTPVLTLFPHITAPERLRIAFPTVSYGRGEPQRTDEPCERHVDCEAATVLSAQSEAVESGTQFGRDIDLSHLVADCLVMTAYRATRKSPPPKAKKRAKRKR